MVKDCQTTGKTAGILTESVEEGLIEETSLEGCTSGESGGVATEIGLKSGGKGSHRGVTVVFCPRDYRSTGDYSVYTKNGADGNDECLNMSFCKPHLVRCFGNSMTGVGTYKFGTSLGNTHSHNMFQINVPKGEFSSINVVENTEMSTGYYVFGTGYGSSTSITQCVVISNSVSYFVASAFEALGNALFGNKFAGNISVIPTMLGLNECRLHSAPFSEMKPNHFGRGMVGHLLIVSKVSKSVKK